MPQEENNDTKPTLLIMSPEPLTEERPLKRIRFGEQDNATLTIKPLGFTTTAFTTAFRHPSPVVESSIPEPRSTKPTKADIAAIIASATTTAANMASAKLPPAPDKEKKEKDVSGRSGRPKEPSTRPKATKEQRLLKLIGPIVVKCMSKYQSQLEHNTFKKHAKKV